MIPFRDENPSSRFPIMTVILITINVLVWLLEVYMQSINQFDQFIRAWGLIPYDVINDPGFETLSNIFSSMFMHGDWLHIGGNMLYLWIFGDNVEDKLGPVLFLMFYLAAGIAADAAHVISAPMSQIPTVGASGAIAGVLGAYLILFPKARVQTVVIAFRMLRVVSVQALWVLGFWFVLQLIQGFVSLGAVNVAGIAYWAHIGGFVAGALMMGAYALLRGIPLFGQGEAVMQPPRQW